MSDIGGEVRLGSMLFTLVEPHRGHEVAYNRWYERDHFYAGFVYDHFRGFRGYDRRLRPNATD